jgi:hypothetical protein
VVPVLIPLTPPVPFWVVPADGDGEPLGRRISRALAESLDQLRRLGTGERDTLDQGWILDIQALTALAQATDDRLEDIGFEFTWSSLVDAPQPVTSRVVFNRQLMQEIERLVPDFSQERTRYETVERHIAHFADREQLEYPIAFIGTVETLRRPRPTLRGDLHGRVRSVWVHLNDEQYQLAIRAHEARLSVLVVGRIRERGAATPSFVEIDRFELSDER